MSTRTTLRTFSLRILEPNQTRIYTLDQQIGKDVICINGVALKTRNLARLLNQATVGLEIDEQVLVEAKTSAHFLVCSSDVVPAEKFYLFLDRNGNPSPEQVKIGRLSFSFAHNPTAEELLAQATLASREAELATALAADDSSEQIANLTSHVNGARLQLTPPYDVQLTLLVVVQR